MRRRVLFRRGGAVCFAAAALLLLAGAPARAAGEKPAYLYQGQRIELEVAPEHLSVGLVQGAELQGVETLSLSSGAVHVASTDLGGNRRRITVGETPLAKQKRQPLSKRLEEGKQGGAGAGRAPAETDAPAGGGSPAARLAAQAEVLATYRADPRVAYAYAALRDPGTGSLLFPTDRILIQVGEGLGEKELAGLLPPTVRVERRLRVAANQFRLRLTDPKADDPLQVAAGLARDYGFIEWAEPDFVKEWRRGALPDDPLIPAQWHVKNTGQGTPAGQQGADAGLEEAWDTQGGDVSIVIAVLDDGVQLSHPDLAPRIFVNPGETPSDGIDNDGNGYVDDVNGWDFFDGDNDPNPILTAPSHGTAVAGVAAAAGDNGEGGSGGCRNCMILPVRISNGVGFAADSTIAEAVAYAGQFADVLNNSWGGGGPSATLTSAIDDVAANGRGGKGAPVLFSTGNAASGYLQLTVTGFAAGTYTVAWVYGKDSFSAAGFDTAWLDNVVLPGGTVQTFEGCSGLPAGWLSDGNAQWVAVNDETRASSTRGGNCSMRAGTVGNSQFSRIYTTFTTSGGDLTYQIWVSAEANTLDGTGDLREDDFSGADECFDGTWVEVYDGSLNFLGSFWYICGTWSNQGQLLQDGSILYPASLSSTIAVGAVTNFDRRSDYSQWGTALDFVAHSGGGSLGITTTDITGANGYADGDGNPSTGSTSDTSTDPDYTDSFGGTSSAAPLAAGIAALALSENPALTAAQVRTVLQGATRQVGPLGYSAGRNDKYGYGALNAADAVIAAAATSTTEDTSGDDTSSGNDTSSRDNPTRGDTTASSGGGGGGACLISYATRGFLSDHDLDPLRRVRSWLRAQGPRGAAIVRAYYDFSAWVLPPPHAGPMAALPGP